MNQTRKDGAPGSKPKTHPCMNNPQGWGTRRERVRSRNGIRDAKGADDSAELASLQVGEDGDVEF